jgi:transposase
MSRKCRTRCPQCQRLRQEVEALKATVRQLQEQLAQAGKNSTTSSKPPSSDIVKPPKPSPAPQDTPRRQGGQPGHPMHQRTPFAPEQLTAPPHAYRLDRCPDCGGQLRDNPIAPRTVQQIDWIVVPLVIEEHRSYAHWCPCCDKTHYAPLPQSVAQGGLLGPNLTALVGYLKGACHASFSTIRKFLRDVIGVRISRGFLAKVISKVSDALAAPYQELLEDLPERSRLNVDETSHKDKGQPWWTWVFRSELYTLFKIEPTRSADVLLEVLGEEFNGVLGCDYFSAYRRYLRECDVVVQFCLAHLIRDVKYLTTLPDKRDQSYGQRLLAGLRELFGVIHRRQGMSRRRFEEELQRCRDAVLEVGLSAPATANGQRLRKRFAEHGREYFEFVTTPGVEPTNNLAEQAIRFVVLDRVVTQGTRGEKGRTWSERIWTVLATCVRQGKSAYEYLREAVRALFEGEPSPSLLPR